MREGVRGAARSISVAGLHTSVREIAKLIVEEVRPTVGRAATSRWSPSGRWSVALWSVTLLTLQAKRLLGGLGDLTTLDDVSLEATDRLMSTGGLLERKADASESLNGSNRALKRAREFAAGVRQGGTTMPTIYLDSALSDEERRHRLYGGDLFAFSPGESATKLAELARELSEAAFAPHDPQVAQESMPAERYVGDPR